MSAATKILMGSGAVDTGPVDDEFNNVSFLSHFDGANNGVNNVFEDDSSSNHTITAVGEATQGTFSPFSRVDGEWSNCFDGVGDYIYPADSSDFTFGTGDFTVECFVNFGDVSQDSVFSTRTATGNSSAGFMVTAFQSKIQMFTAGAFKIVGASITTNQWYHVAISRASGTTRLFLDGTQVGSSYSDSNNYTSQKFKAGGDVSAGYALNGYASNVRVVKGTAIYTSAFTPPTSALTAISGTVLLTCQSNRFKDNSASDHEIIVAATPKVTAFTPILTSKAYDPAVNGGSGYFAGSHDYLTDTGAVAVGSGDFTIEFWVYREAGTQGHAFQYSSALLNSKPHALGFYWFTDGRVYFRGGTSISTGGGYTDIYLGEEEWHHIAIVRSGTTVKLYKDGVLGTSSTFTIAFNYSDTYLVVGAGYSATFVMTGYLSDFRLVKGSAVYTSDFTPPTAPLTAITNTVLLLNMANGQAIDSVAQNNLTLVGNTKTSTTQQKFGTSSLHLDGAGDYVISVSDSVAPFGTGDFTIELWARRTDGGNQGFFQFSSSPLNGQSGAGPGLGVYSNGLYLYYGKEGALQGRDLGGTLPGVGTWFHVAYVRASGVIQIYVDGTAYGSTTASTVKYTAPILTLGGYYTSSFLWNGYIDEFRISHVARYTSNFTPSTEAFPDKGQ